MHILANMTPLMIFLVKLIHGDLLENFFDHFHHILTYDLIFTPQKWTNLDHFHLKWPILTKLTPINGIVDQS